MLEAASLEPRPVMSEDEAGLVLSRVMAEVRRPPRVGGWPVAAQWLAGMGVAAAVLAALVSPRPADNAGEVLRESVIHAEADGREVYIRVVAYKQEE
jgi:hypothetical protein